MSDEKKPIDDGGPAFPVPVAKHPTIDTLVTPGSFMRGGDGMTLRDFFAATALRGLVPRLEAGRYYPVDAAAEAYRVADAMLAERTKPPADFKPEPVVDEEIPW